MSDLAGDPLRRRNSLQQRLISLLHSYGYRPLDTPLLEPTELFLRKSGGEMASQLLSFNDPAGRAVTLRPEFTAPAIRHYIEHSGEIVLPARWCYCGPVFRFDATVLQDYAPARSQFTQIGAELLGSPGILADVELLTLATAVLSESGISGWTLRLADLDVLNSLLDPVGLSERARAFVVQNVPRLTEGSSAIPDLLEESRRLHVVGRLAEDEHLSQAVQGLSDDEARTVLLGVLRSNSLDQMGQRKPEEVVERLLRKIRRPDAEEALRLALESACDLAQVRGDAKSALAGASATLVKAGADTSAIDRMEQVIGMLPDGLGQSGQIALDFGLVRGLAYYNGMVFEVSHPGSPAPLGGGGRYDGLARDLGGDGHLPALGFAYNLDALADLAPDEPGSEETAAEGILVVASTPNAQSAAVGVAQQLRQQGQTVEMEVCGRDVSDALSYASRRGLRRMVTVERDGGTTSYDV
jgi:histidyl-tRNA synthetase